MPRPLEHSHCTVEGCGRPHKARGYCAAHYLQYTRNLAVKPIQERSYAHAAVCSVAGCDKPERSKGMCGTHYMRWHRHGDVGFRYKASVG